MMDKTLIERLREPDWWMDDTLNEEAADHIDALEGVLMPSELRTNNPQGADDA